MVLKRKTKNPPVLSHEFVIQNHGDIMSCVALVFVVGLMFQVTAPLCSMFIVAQHNVTEEVVPGSQYNEYIIHYTNGLRDLAGIFFYFLICIVIHAVIQEYILDKLNRKMHLSKLKHSKFNESGQLVVFYLVSIFWGGHIILKENLVPSMSALWVDYPHTEMVFMTKFWFIIQLSYWAHCYPELYFQKIKKSEWTGRCIYPTLYLMFIGAAYSLNFTRLALCLAVLHYTVECLFNICRLISFAEKAEVANIGFGIWNVMFPLVRVLSITLSVLTFWYGLGLQQNQVLDVATGNFNTLLIRLNSLVAVCFLQAWMMWKYITFHIRRRHGDSTEEGDEGEENTTRRSKRVKDEDDSDLPEVDQNTKKTLRNRGAAVKTADPAKSPKPKSAVKVVKPKSGKR